MNAAYEALRKELKDAYRGNKTDNQYVTHLLMPIIERYTLPRPLFEDGEPVQFGSEFMGESMEAATVDQFCYHEDHVSLWSDEWSKKDDECCKISFYSNDRKPVKRPVPEVLDADGVPIRVGDTVWTSDGMEWRVNRVDGTTVHVTTPGGGSGVYPFLDDGVSPFTHTPPDSIEQVVEDMRKQIVEWDADDGYLNGAMVAYERIRDRLCDLMKEGA